MTNASGNPMDINNLLNSDTGPPNTGTGNGGPSNPNPTPLVPNADQNNDNNDAPSDFARWFNESKARLSGNRLIRSVKDGNISFNTRVYYQALIDGHVTPDNLLHWGDFNNESHRNSKWFAYMLYEGDTNPGRGYRNDSLPAWVNTDMKEFFRVKDPQTWRRLEDGDTIVHRTLKTKLIKATTEPI